VEGGKHAWQPLRKPGVPGRGWRLLFGAELPARRSSAALADGASSLAPSCLPPVTVAVPPARRSITCAGVPSEAPAPRRLRVGSDRHRCVHAPQGPSPGGPRDLLQRRGTPGLIRAGSACSAGMPLPLRLLGTPAGWHCQLLPGWFLKNAHTLAKCPCRLPRQRPGAVPVQQLRAEGAAGAGELQLPLPGGAVPRPRPADCAGGGRWCDQSWPHAQDLTGCAPVQAQPTAAAALQDLGFNGSLTFDPAPARRLTAQHMGWVHALKRIRDPPDSDAHGSPGLVALSLQHTGDSSADVPHNACILT